MKNDIKYSPWDESRKKRLLIVDDKSPRFVAIVTDDETIKNFQKLNDASCS